MSTKPQATGRGRKPPSPRTLVLIDADPIVYRCGFAAETPYYDVIVEHKEREEVTSFHFAPADDKSAGDRMNEWVAAHADEWNVIGKFRGATPQPVGNAVHAVKEQIKSIISECEDWAGSGVGIALYLSGPGNYREDIATLRPYKGNRDPAHKPVHYQAIREYLYREYGARIVVGREADDQVSIDARQMARAGEPFIIATIDKDLDQIPGRHYNYMKKVRYTIDEDEALTFFYQQCISGDGTDNIGGAYKYGTAKAQKIVSGVMASDFYDDRIEYALWDAVLDTYDASKTIPGCPYVDVPTEAVALENARLVKLQEYEGQLWSPPGVPDELVPWVNTTE